LQPINPIFERNLKGYLEQLGKISIAHIAPKLGATFKDDIACIKLFNTEYRISAKTITGPSGRRPGYDVCVILSKYFLLCPAQRPECSDLIPYREFTGASPLVNFFSNEVERAIASYFSQRIDDLKKAARILGGHPPDLDAAYDFSARFYALPKIPVILLFNDADGEFPAKSCLLFERRAEYYLDAECLAMLGRHLFHSLKKALRQMQA